MPNTTLKAQKEGALNKLRCAIEDMEQARQSGSVTCYEEAYGWALALVANPLIPSDAPECMRVKLIALENEVEAQKSMVRYYSGVLDYERKAKGWDQQLGEDLKKYMAHSQQLNALAWALGVSLGDIPDTATSAFVDLKALTEKACKVRAEREALRIAVMSLLSHVERNTCTHDETYRGGNIWEICQQCGAKWADDEGGKPEFKWPDCVEKARAVLRDIGIGKGGKV